MNGHRHLELPANKLAPRRARLEVRDMLSRQDSSDDVVAALLVTEMVTNAVRHASPQTGATVKLDLDITDGCLRVEVVDEGIGFDVAEASVAPGGYGLLLIERLSDGWGVIPGPPHRVWCELTV